MQCLSVMVDHDDFMCVKMSIMVFITQCYKFSEDLEYTVTQIL